METFKQICTVYVPLLEISSLFQSFHGLVHFQTIIKYGHVHVHIYQLELS